LAVAVCIGLKVTASANSDAQFAESLSQLDIQGFGGGWRILRDESMDFVK
jgi:hypothetical protein